MDATKTKGILLSKTFWASLIPIAISLLQVSDQYLGTNLMQNHWISAALAVAGVLGIYGRKTADTKIEGLI